jgi:hypothetical protein
MSRLLPFLLAALVVCGAAPAQDLTPNLVGGQYHTVPPTVTNGQLVGIRVGPDGTVQVNGTVSGTTTANQGTPAVVGNAWPVTLAIGGALNAVGNPVFIAPGTGATFALGAGSAIAGKFGIDQTTPVTTNGVNINPTTASAAGIVPVVSASAEGSHVFCAAACNLWSIYVTAGASAGFLMTFNATSAPADGAVTPVECVQVAANSTVALSFGSGPPDRYSTGATAVFSTTGCFNKTVSATAFFKARTT